MSDKRIPDNYTPEDYEAGLISCGEDDGEPVGWVATVAIIGCLLVLIFLMFYGFKMILGL